MEEGILPLKSYLCLNYNANCTFVNRKYSKKQKDLPGVRQTLREDPGFQNLGITLWFSIRLASWLTTLLLAVL